MRKYEGLPSYKKRNIYVAVTTEYILTCLMYYLDGSIANRLGYLAFSLCVYIYIFKKISANAGVLQALVSMIIISVPISLRNIFGASTAGMPITWIYIFTFLLGAYTVVKRNIFCRKWEYIFGIFIMYHLILVILSENKLEALKICLVYMVFLGSFWSGIKWKNTLKVESEKWVVGLYIAGGVFASVITCGQFVIKLIFGVSILQVYTKTGRIGCYFLFEDMSHYSLYLASVAIMCFLDERKNCRRMAVMTVIASVITSSRTGILAFVIGILVAFIRGKRKGMFMVKAAVNALVGVSVLFLTRSKILQSQSEGNIISNSKVTNVIRNLADDNGRSEAIEATMEVYTQSNMWLGAGFDSNYQMKATDDANRVVMAHFALIRLLCEGGPILAIGYLAIIGVIIVDAFKNVRYQLPSVLVACIAGSFLIPSFFSAHFFCALVMVSLMSI